MDQWKIIHKEKNGHFSIPRVCGLTGSSTQVLQSSVMQGPYDPKCTIYLSLTVCRLVLNYYCSSYACPKKKTTPPPLPQHPQTPMHALILYTREGKVQQLPMQSHPASCVPEVLLNPRSCGCLSPFPLLLTSAAREGEEVRERKR